MPPKILQIKNKHRKCGKRDHEGNQKKWKADQLDWNGSPRTNKMAKRIVQGMLKAGSQKPFHIVHEPKGRFHSFICHQEQIQHPNRS